MIDNYEYNNKSFLINSLEQRKLLVKEDIVFLFHDMGVEIGRINKQAVFIQKYIFAFDQQDIFESEKQFLISQPVEEYIKKRRCQENYYDIQQLKDENNYLGDLIILKNNILDDELETNIKDKQIKNCFKDYINMNKQNLPSYDKKINENQGKNHNTNDIPKIIDPFKKKKIPFGGLVILDAKIIKLLKEKKIKKIKNKNL